MHTNKFSPLKNWTAGTHLKISSPNFLNGKIPCFGGPMCSQHVVQPTKLRGKKLQHSGFTLQEPLNHAVHEALRTWWFWRHRRKAPKKTKPISEMAIGSLGAVVRILMISVYGKNLCFVSPSLISFTPENLWARRFFEGRPPQIIHPPRANTKALSSKTPWTKCIRRERKEYH